MSTIVERPMSAINDIQTSGSRPRRESIEIIDVDSLDIVGSSSQAHPVQPGNVRRGSSSRDSIWLIDSDDDEVEILSSRVLSGYDADRSRSHRRLISPPPPRSSNQAPPPVPALHSRQTMGQPVRRQLNTISSMPVFPTVQPLAFEAGPIAGPSNGPNPPNPPLQAAPISRHVPPLGLGGALISSNNRAQNIRQQARSAATTARRNAISNQGIPTSYSTRFHAYLAGDVDGIPPHIQMYLRAHEASDETFDADLHDTLQQSAFMKQATREKEQYQQHYTHPSQPEPGFTFDFAPPSLEDDVTRSRLFPPTSINEPIILDDDDDDGPSQAPSGPSASSGQKESSPGTGTLNALLVCAKCLDPLVLNAGLAPEEAQYKRVWGLRCGHLIDEKCLNELGQPSQQEEQPTPTKDRKGKGKAKAVAPPTYGDALPEQQSFVETAAAEIPSIRSRLRTRPNAASSSTSAAAGPSSSTLAPASAPAPARPIETPSPPAKKRRGPNKKPRIEGEFEWTCPVADCGRVHLSVKIDGVWGPETDRDFKGVKGLKTEARGAVAVFA